MDYLLVMVSFMNLLFQSNYSLIYLGCRQSFCSNHSVDHSNELRNRLEEITNEYNSVNEMFCDYKQKPNDFQCERNQYNQIRNT
jgi:hypothetical protein